jgi:hypothetical protein
MPYSVRSADLRSMTPEERYEELEKIVNGAQLPLNGRGRVIAAKIRTFEQRYEITSAQLLAALKNGSCKETAEISLWLFWLDAKARGDR